MNRAVGALGQSFAQHLLRARRPGGNHHDFATVLFLLAQRFFERISVGLVDFIGDVFANPRAAFVQFQRGVLLRDLLHADQNFHKCGFPVILDSADAGVRQARTQKETSKYKRQRRGGGRRERLPKMSKSPKSPELQTPSRRVSNSPILAITNYSTKATDCTPATSKRLRQRMFLHITMSSRGTI